MKDTLSNHIKHDGRVDFKDSDKTYTIMSVIPVRNVMKCFDDVKDTINIVIDEMKGNDPIIKLQRKLLKSFIDDINERIGKELQ